MSKTSDAPYLGNDIVPIYLLHSQWKDIAIIMLRAADNASNNKEKGEILDLVSCIHMHMSKDWETPKKPQVIQSWDEAPKKPHTIQSMGVEYFKCAFIVPNKNND